VAGAAVAGAAVAGAAVAGAAVAGAAVAGLAVAAGAAQPETMSTVTNAAMINLFKLACLNISFSPFSSDYGWNDRKLRKNIVWNHLLIKNMILFHRTRCQTTDELAL
jgi:hypothetical protein